MDKSLFRYFLECYTKRFFNFKRRARRKEYWGFVLFNMVVYSILEIIESSLPILKPLISVTAVFTLIAALSVMVRRFHDTNRSGWWCLIWLVPFIGTLWFLVLMCKKGTQGPNLFGPDPLEEEIEVIVPA